MTVDFLQGFFQCALDEDSQHLYSMSTPFGNYTFKRTPQGAASCPGHFHNQLAKTFRPIMAKGQAILWIDDLLVMGRTFDEFMEAVREMLELCALLKLSLSVKKCDLGSSQVKWCGRIINAVGVRMESRSATAFAELRTPETAGVLSTFYHALTWMSEHLVRWAEYSSPLKTLLDSIKATCAASSSKGKATKRKYENIRLVNAGWTDEHQAAFDKCKEALAQAITQGHYDEACTLCMFTDASDTHWAGLLTQVRHWRDDLPIEQQQHEPLGTLSGAFTYVQRNWSVIEKESYPILKMLGHYDYILQSPQGFRIYCDHQNIVTLFHPEKESAALSKMAIDKVYRWLYHLGHYRITHMEHLPGQRNLWADLLSREGHPTYGPKRSREDFSFRAFAARRGAGRQGAREDGPIPAPRRFHQEYLKLMFDPLHNHHILPDKGVVITAQHERNLSTADRAWKRDNRDKLSPPQDDGAMYVVKGNRGREDWRLWLPHHDKLLLTRFMIAAHCGRAGHVSAQKTYDYLRANVWWQGMKEDVFRFCMEDCLCCLKTSNTTEPRMWGRQLRGTSRGEVIHFDYMYIGANPEGTCHDFEYVLVIKDDYSGLVELVPCARADARHCAEALLWFFARYATPQHFITDRGTHFKNQILQRIAELTGVNHRLTPAYNPASNGSVEVVNKSLRKLLTCLITENRMQNEDWPFLLPIVQRILNERVTEKGFSAKEIFMGLDQFNPVHLLLAPDNIRQAVREIVIQIPEVEEEVAILHERLNEIHRKVTENRRNLQDMEIRSRDNQVLRLSRNRHFNSTELTRHLNSERANEQFYEGVNFERGDFVLVAQASRSREHKLRANWKGPFRVTRAVSDHVYEVEHLISRKLSLVHSRRLKFYCDNELDSSIPLELVVQREEACESAVESILECKYVRATHDYAFKVKWVGFEEVEASWEDPVHIYAMEPVMVEEFVQRLRNGPMKRALVDLLDLDQQL